MRLPLRPAALFVLSSFALISAVSLFPCLLGQPVQQKSLLLLTSLLCWTLLWSLFKSPRWFLPLLLPAMLAAPVELYLQLYYGQGISTHHLGIMLETSPREATEFLGDKIYLLIGLFILICGWWTALWWAAGRSPELKWRHSSRWISLVLLSALSALICYQTYVGVAAQLIPKMLDAASASAASASASGSGASSEASEEDEDAASASADAGSPAIAGIALANPTLERWRRSLLQHPGALPHWLKLPFDADLLGRSWPFGLILKAADFWNEREYLNRLAEKSRSFRFNARLEGDPALAQTIVMVIGESSRYDRWSLNGYQRETNPLLSKETNLVPLADMITAVSATRLSVPIIVSRKPATLGLQAGFAEKSFISAFREAGFKTYWISNQMSFGQFDTPISVFAKEADVVQFLNLGGYTDRSNFDDILFAPLNHALQDSSPKKLIVLHTLGNHWNYSHRYPKPFDRWQPSLFGVDNPVFTDLSNKQALNNSYDNSILYTDWILSQFIAQLKQRKDQISSLMYVSDHGQTLYDGSCQLAFHGHNTQYEFHIPAFIWYSDSYQQQFPDKIEQLHRHQKARLSTENVFHTLTDMGNLSYPDQQPEWSILNRRLKRHTRYVDSYGWSNYDRSKMRGDCREVIDKKPPLKQSR